MGDARSSSPIPGNPAPGVPRLERPIREIDLDRKPETRPFPTIRSGIGVIRDALGIIRGALGIIRGGRLGDPVDGPRMATSLAPHEESVSRSVRGEVVGY
jgi:hypothetical protein